MTLSVCTTVSIRFASVRKGNVNNREFAADNHSRGCSDYKARCTGGGGPTHEGTASKGLGAHIIQYLSSPLKVVPWDK